MKKKIICLVLSAAVVGGFAVSAKAKQDFVLNGLESEYYIRINAVDKNGVLSKVSSILSKHNIGVAQLVQEKRVDTSDGVPIVIVTHMTKENNVNKAIADINAISEITKDYAVIRLISK